MKTRTLLIITFVILIGITGMTIANVNQQTQSGNSPAQQAVQISEAEKEEILYIRQEEKLARDVYIALYELWGTEIFANISESEQRHMDAIKNLIKIYGLEDPVKNEQAGQFTNQSFLDLYNLFVDMGSSSLEDALNVGILIEQQDIDDITEALTKTTKRNVERVFQNLRNGSYRHLAAFQSCLVNCIE